MEVNNCENIEESVKEMGAFSTSCNRSLAAA